ncbi:hypothetical protein [Facklamia sp. 7083-14-GEN3]|uniref:hypothetical protein n=1 Tax=Facklamia sp. 7083-14-GEN3 TaxID=2973478 RepID=UPI00215BF62B|nr:hypothetical protein [Facklamia sp. 7083-14-GEN3]MCR8968505.1 hypothetical protein [Facklamia sp. 7083-14-GEN3]
MNIQTFLILFLIVGGLIFLLKKEWQSLKAGKSKCTSCTVKDCPLAGLNVKPPTNITGCSCEQISDQERQAIQKELAQNKIKLQNN